MCQVLPSVLFKPTFSFHQITFVGTNGDPATVNVLSSLVHYHISSFFADSSCRWSSRWIFWNRVTISVILTYFHLTSSAPIRWTSSWTTPKQTFSTTLLPRHAIIYLSLLRPPRISSSLSSSPCLPFIVSRSLIWCHSKSPSRLSCFFIQVLFTTSHSTLLSIFYVIKFIYVLFNITFTTYFYHHNILLLIFE